MTPLLENIIAVEVEKIGASYADYYWVGIDNQLWGTLGQLDFPIEPLPEGNWQFLFCTESVTEEQAAGIVGWFELAGMVGYQIYEAVNDYRFPFKTAKESLQSLLSSKGLKKNYALLKKIN